MNLKKCEMVNEKKKRNNKIPFSLTSDNSYELWQINEGLIIDDKRIDITYSDWAVFLVF